MFLIRNGQFFPNKTQKRADVFCRKITTLPLTEGGYLHIHWPQMA